jgi:hypothetical protein
MTDAKILRIPPDEYHLRDGLSSSIATTLITRSPLHAWSQHPMYGARGKTPTDEMDFGSVVHALSLGAGKRFAVLPFDDFRTNAAKASRDNARAEGLIPIKHASFSRAQDVAAKVIAGLREVAGIVLDGESELGFEWDEPSPSGPVLCRAMMDHVFLDRGLIVDLKIVSSAAPASVERSAENFGYAIQAAAYTRALTAIAPHLAGRVRFLFAFCEAEFPYAMNVTEPDGMFREIGERRWERAVHAWGKCVVTNSWPAYGTGINTLSPPPWALSREELAA